MVDSNYIKWKITILSVFIFILIINPYTYMFTQKILGRFIGKIADASGCPTLLGLLIHTIVYILLIRGVMELTHTVPIYNSLKYLGEGEESMVFLLPDSDNTIKILKNCNKCSNMEISTITKMINNTPLYFVKIIAFGKCIDVKDKLKSDIVNFCNNKLIGDTCNYSYILMKIATGGTFLQYYGLQFKDLLNNNDFDKLIKNVNMTVFVRLLFSFLNKIIDGLIDANTKLGGFIHNDLDYRNCYIDPLSNPIIIDFGLSTIGKIGDNTDILFFIKKILSDENLESPLYISIFPDYELKSDLEKTLIKNNFYKLNTVLRSNPKINALITKYFTYFPTINKGMLLLMLPARQSLETFKIKLNTF